MELPGPSHEAGEAKPTDPSMTGPSDTGTWASPLRSDSGLLALWVMWLPGLQGTPEVTDCEFGRNPQ